MKVMTQSGAVRHAADQWDSTTALLAATPAPAGREAVWVQALAFLDAGHRDGAHLVASVLVIDAGGLVLLARHHRYWQWGPLGGHLDPGDASLSAAAARELLEEAALAAHVHPAPIDVRLSPTGAGPPPSRFSISTCASPRLPPRPPRLSSPIMS